MPPKVVSLDTQYFLVTVICRYTIYASSDHLCIISLVFVCSFRHSQRELTYFSYEYVSVSTYYGREYVIRLIFWFDWIWVGWTRVSVNISVQSPALHLPPTPSLPTHPLPSSPTPSRITLTPLYPSFSHSHTQSHTVTECMRKWMQIHVLGGWLTKKLFLFLYLNFALSQVSLFISK